jgi:hypothetical protein
MWVAQQMGHADWTMIAQVYGRWIPDAIPDAGQKAVATFGLMDREHSDFGSFGGMRGYSLDGMDRPDRWFDAGNW